MNMISAKTSKPMSTSTILRVALAAIVAMLSCVLAACAGLVIIVWTTGSVQAAVSLAKEHLTISLAGGAALYCVLFWLAMRAIVHFADSFSLSKNTEEETKSDIPAKA